MKFSGGIFLTLLVQAQLLAVVAFSGSNLNQEQQVDSYEPFRISFRDLGHLLEDDGHHDPARLLLDETLHKAGLFSITDIPGFARTKPDTLQHLAPCLEETTESARHVFADGTLRQTLATIPGEPLISKVDGSGEACVHLQEQSRGFRQTVDDVLQTVAALLQSMVGMEEEHFLLKDANGDDSYTLHSTLVEGEQLEHFHVYSSTTDASDKSTSNTLDWHTDQGILLVFSPGVRLGEPSQQDFFIRLDDNEDPRAVQFTSRDELVVMLGQGISLVHPERFWRPVPHALRVQPGLPSRSWYGRMVLPPTTAIHPLVNQTFGELRTQQISTQTSSASPTLACGTFTTTTTTTTTTRFLQDVTEEDCQPDAQHFCWHRCLNYTETVSPSACTEPEEVACVNTERQLWTGAHDPNFELGCIDVSEAEEAPGEEEEAEEDAPINDEQPDEDEQDEDSTNEDSSSSTTASRQLGRLIVFVGLAAVAASLYG